jgi:hypothetical protein
MSSIAGKGENAFSHSEMTSVVFGYGSWSVCFGSEAASAHESSLGAAVYDDHVGLTDLLKTVPGLARLRAVETGCVMVLTGGSRPVAYWWHDTPLKNVARGHLRT